MKSTINKQPKENTPNYQKHLQKIFIILSLLATTPVLSACDKDMTRSQATDMCLDYYGGSFSNKIPSCVDKLMGN
ncbi:MAG: hypothetical protein KAI16_01420 [Candidatus Pacebacteria bacterium]|nr:hypothetical protein [Candidatus Paceibacterota bacterium]